MEEPISGIHVGADGSESERPKPIFFLHIPKTAGTSFLLMLQNTFGDNRVHRIRTIGEDIQQVVDGIVAADLNEISCLTGHLPLHLLKEHLHKFRTFTLLRDPISRIGSLFRFLKLKSSAEIERLGLQADFSISEFLISKNPELYGQTNNGMVRMLCGDPKLSDPEDALFWNMSGSTDALEQALSNLERMDFGLAEQMRTTLEFAQAQWSVPYTLGEFQENRTVQDGIGDDIETIHRIVLQNTQDLALYQKARAMYFARRPTKQRPLTDRSWNSLAVFHAPINEDVPIGNIPGRRGFYEFEEIGLAWLQESLTAEVNFVSSPGLRSLTLHLHCLFTDYPIEGTLIRVNGSPIRFKLSPGGVNWHWMRTEQFEVRSGLNRLEIDAPLYVSVESVNPQTNDKRRLGVAVSQVNLHD